MNEVLSSTKDNSMQNNNHKKKVFLNSKNKNKIENKKTNNINNINSENSLKQKMKKKKMILSNNAVYEGSLNNNEFDGYGEYRSPSYNYFGYFSCGKKSGKGKLEDFVKKLEYSGDFKTI